MIPDQILDPLTSFNFYVTLFEIDANRSGFGSFVAGAQSALGTVLGGFSECSGLDSEIEITEIKAGGVNDRVYQFPGRASYSTITLKQGMAFSEDLLMWHESFVNGEGLRRDGLIFIANETRVPIKIWRFERGIPRKWSGPALNAGTSGIAIETLEIAHEKLSLLASPGKALATVASAIGDAF